MLPESKKSYLTWKSVSIFHIKTMGAQALRRTTGCLFLATVIEYIFVYIFYICLWYKQQHKKPLEHNFSFYKNNLRGCGRNEFNKSLTLIPGSKTFTFNQKSHGLRYRPISFEIILGLFSDYSSFAHLLISNYLGFSILL